MDETGSRVFAMTVNLPRSYMGRAQLRVDAESVTLVARPIRLYRTIVLTYVVVVLVVMAVVLMTMPGSLEIRALVVGVLAGMLAGGTFWLLRSSGGDPRSMRLPITAVSLAKRNGRVLVVRAAFDIHARPGRWTLVADSRDDAEAITHVLTTGDGQRAADDGSEQSTMP